jgi:hypothetical protein
MVQNYVWCGILCNCKTFMIKILLIKKKKKEKKKKIFIFFFFLHQLNIYSFQLSNVRYYVDTKVEYHDWLKISQSYLIGNFVRKLNRIICK